MRKIVVSSLEEKAGKTVAIAAMSKLFDGKIGYMKPFGNKPVYDGKRLTDYDALLFKELFDLPYTAQEMVLGVHYSRIMAYKNIEEEFRNRYKKLSKGRDIFIVEGGETIWKGTYKKLDAISIASKINGEIVFVIQGDKFERMDKASYIKLLKSRRIKGVIINRVKRKEMVDEIEEMGIPVLGIIPEIKKLNTMRVDYIAEKLSGRIVAGEKGLNKYVENIFIAALAAPDIKRHPDYKKKNKLIITGGDRSDVITACIEKNTSAIVLTNNIIPSSNILAKADREGIPIISVRPDTYTVAKHIENMPKPIMASEKEKIREIQKKARIEI
ncbi:MAG: phosphotransacetylase family protein [Thermoplasmata archaeon]|nr:phosphotransacetylase family protein [Thermoplasmata archaeon]